ncbi:MAG: hypothetical protein ABWY78_06415 [Microvirga sp.]
MDEMKITILEDGTIRTETNPISPVNHQSAEDFMQQVRALTGGAVTRQRKGHHHTHAQTTHTHSK